MSQLLFPRTGPPAEVLEIHPQERPVPGPGEVLLKMQAAAVNPADLNFIEGTYGVKPTLPATPGMEGAALISALGEGVSGLHPGTAVLPLETPGNWAQWRVLPASRIFVLPSGIDLRQAALLRVNPPTAWGLLHTQGTPAPGGWIVQNAASSAAGHCIIQLAKILGLHTLNFVRRPESIPVCEALGADLVFPDDAGGLATAKNTLAEQRIPAPQLAFNAVGGDSALRLLDLLAPNGTHVTYGAMGRQALKVPNGMLIFKSLTLKGFWLNHWTRAMGPEGMEQLYGKLAGLVMDGSLHQKIAAAYPVEQYREAVEHAAQPGRNGKVLLTF